MVVEKDINGVEYSYENKDELAFGTYFEEEVEITGYIFPFDLEGNYYILSKFPYSACFFCSKDGSVGPETVMELKIKERYDWFQMDDIVTFKGKMKLNDTDINQLYYILEDAEVVGQ